MSVHFGDFIRRYVPPAIKRFVRRFIDLSDLDRDRRFNAFRDLLSDSTFDGDASLPRLGIFSEFFYYHKDYIRACREMGVSYTVLDLSADDWMSRVRNSFCSGFLVWPTPVPTPWKRMFDDRIRILSEDLNAKIFPSMKELWLYESKYRVRDWLDAHGFPRPQTWIFFDESDAREFGRFVRLPVVVKTESGGSASGVHILSNRGEISRMVGLAFGRGLALRGHNPRDRVRGSILFQEFFSGVKEWRMVRVGDSFFGYRKEPGHKGLHSASHRWSWLDPPRPLLDLLFQVTEAGEFTSMDVDVFETQDGRYLVNELQTVFGATTPVDQLRVNGRPGRYIKSITDGGWEFEEGDFCRNALCNLRIAHFLSHLSTEDIG